MSAFFESCCLIIDGIPYPLPREVPELLQRGAIVVDLREEIETEIRAFGIEKVLYIPHSEFEEKWSILPSNKPLILADDVGLWSKKYTLFLKSKGYEDVSSLAGGMADWEKDGLPVKAGRYQPLNGPCACMIKPKEKK
jgi:rhodanese-related sulfurtransferase